ncbi:MAG TPA: MurR/RpiR family transcriptional regulator [Burkholderiaceae bacterium]|nr:MurR/RpiR family transcriptional regulator [Burkholderiaceae bacterium]
MTSPVPAPAKPATVDQLLQRISDEYDDLSKQLKAIGQHVERHRDQLGLEGIQDVAAQCAVQPSAVVRFAKHFGFSGFSEMQRVFRDGLARQIAPGRNYQARIRDAIASGAGNLSSADIAHEFLGGSIAGMQELQNSLHAPTLKKAVDLLARADTIWIAGARRSFPVAVYLDYALQHTDKRIGLVTALGSMQDGAIRSVRKGDVLIAISFAPYATETLEVARAAARRGATLLAITDSRMGDLARLAHVVLKVQEHATFGFRALSSTMGLAQSLFIALAYRLELSYQN